MYNVHVRPVILAALGVGYAVAGVASCAPTVEVRPDAANIEWNRDSSVAGSAGGGQGTYVLPETVAFGGVTVVGDDLFAGFGPRIVAFDVSDPETPVFEGRTGVLGASAMRIVPGSTASTVVVALRGATTDGTGRVAVVDVSQSPPVILSTVTTPSEPNDVVVSGSRGYVTAEASGLHVIDLTMPEAPTLMGSSVLSGAMGIDVSGTTAYVADAGRLMNPEGSGPNPALRILDVSNPESPELEASVAVTESLGRIVVGGGYAYASGWSGLHVLSVGNANSAAEVALLAMPGAVTDLQLDGLTLYVSLVPRSSIDEVPSVVVVDVTTPSSPELVVESEDSRQGAVSIGLLEDDVVVSTPDGVSIMEQADLSIVAPTASTRSWVEHVAVHTTGDVAYFADRFRGVRVVDISTPTAPNEGTAVDVPAELVAVVDDVLYAVGDSTVSVLDITTPTVPALLGQTSSLWPESAVVGGLVITDGLAIVTTAMTDDGVVLVDVSDPYEPSRVSSVAYVAPIQSVVAGDRLYTVDLYGIGVVDISDHESPVKVGGIRLGAVQNMALAGGRGFVAAAGEFSVLDVTSGVTPTLSASIDFPYIPVDVELVGDYAFVSTTDAGLVLVDVSDPDEPAVAGVVDGLAYARGLATYSDMVAVALGDGYGLVSASDPESATVAVVVDGPG